MNKKNITLGLVVLLIAGSIYYLESKKVDIGGAIKDADIAVNDSPNQVLQMTLEDKAKNYERAKEIVQPGQFFNTENNQPVTIQDLVGKKIILVDFWTYSCINCQRTTPYLNAWHDKYAKEGLVILGLHSPEFDFEKKPENVQEAIDRFKIEYPVIQDNDFGTWRAYKNRYWPRKYLIDIDGFIVYDHIGEGAYDETEAKIQELLKEKASRLNEEVSFKSGELAEPTSRPTASSRSISPEVYFGAWRNEFLANGVKNKQGSQVFEISGTPKQGGLYLEGAWMVEDKFIINEKPKAKIVYPYRAQEVFMVLAADEPVRLKVLVDGQAISKEMAGEDVDEDGYLTVQKERLYKIIKNGDHSTFQTLDLQADSPGLKAFTFTFG